MTGNAASGLLPAGLVQAALLAIASPVPETEQADLGHAAGRVVARDVFAACDFPAFDHAAMDGYAVALGAGLDRFTVIGRSAAGDAPARALAPGEAIRIFTGAALPAGADAVVRQEDAVLREGRLEPAVRAAPGLHVRRAGEDVRAGDPVLARGAMVDPRGLALLAAVGVDRIEVRRKVRVGIASTGNELVDPGAVRAGGSIFDANRPMLVALFSRSFAEVLDIGIVADDPSRLAGALSDAAQACDLLVSTGGTSVGEEDHLMHAIRLAGGHASRARLAIKPGKPAVFGMLRGTLIAGLPGNPFAALVSALLFAKPCLESLAGLGPAVPAPEPAEAAFAHRHPAGRMEFVPVRVAGQGRAGPLLHGLGPSGAARLRALAEADGLAVIPAHAGDVREGDPVGFLPFPGTL